MFYKLSDNQMTYIGAILILLGMFVTLSGIVGLFRFPSFYTKIHASGIIDACGIPLCLVGLACLQNNTLNSFKLIFASFLILLLSPVATQALAKASLNKNQESLQTKKFK